MAVLAIGAPDKRGAVVVGLLRDDMGGPVPARLACERQLVRGSVVLRWWLGGRELGSGLCGLRRTLRGGEGRGEG